MRPDRPVVIAQRVVGSWCANVRRPQPLNICGEASVGQGRGVDVVDDARPQALPRVAGDSVDGPLAASSAIA